MGARAPGRGGRRQPSTALGRARRSRLLRVRVRAARVLACGWSGVADDGDDEYYDDLFDVKCPRCFQMLLIVSHRRSRRPSARPREGNPKAQRNLEGALKREAFLDRLERECLKSPDELPVLTGDALEFEWDFESDEDAGERWTVIRHGSTEVWREPPSMRHMSASTRSRRSSSSATAALPLIDSDEGERDVALRRPLPVDSL